MDFQPCLFARAYQRISSCLLMSGSLCVCLSLVLLCTHVFGPLTAIFIHAAISPAPCMSFSQSSGRAERTTLETARLLFWEFCPPTTQHGVATCDFLLKRFFHLWGRIPGSGAVQRRTEPRRPLRHILFCTRVSQEALIPSTRRKCILNLSVTLRSSALCHASYLSCFCSLL